MTAQESNPAQLDHTSRLPGDGPRAKLGADALCRTLAGLEIAAIDEHHLELAMAVVELAVDAGSSTPWTPDDPTIVLLRAAAHLARTAPDATSRAAFLLATRLDDTGADRRRSR